MSKYEQLKERIHGPVFSIVTPFNEDESIDFVSLGNYIEKVHEAKGVNFFVMGYNSRFSQLSWDEIKSVNEFVTKKVKSLDTNHIVIVADPLHCSTKVTIEFANHAEEIGADIISLIVRERFYSEEQIYKHFKMVEENSNIGILIHEMPFLNGFGGPTVNWPISLLDRLSDLEHVVAVKEDAKDDTYSKEVINKIKDRVAIVISGGGKGQWLRFADIGCQSWLNGVGVFEPRLSTLFWDHYKKGNKEEYMRIVDEVETPYFESALKKHSWHLSIKAALESRGLMSRKDRMPLMELSQEKTDEISDLIDRLPINDILNKNKFNVEYKTEGYDFDIDDIRKTDEITGIIKEFGICRIPNFLDSETISKLYVESLELVTDETDDSYVFGKATRMQRKDNKKPTIEKVFSDGEMLKIANMFMGATTLNQEIFITHDFKYDNGLARNGYLHFDRIYTFKFFIYLTDVDVNCGPFSIIPKSHIKGKELRNQTSGTYEQLKNRIFLDYTELGYSEEDILPIVGNAGDLMIFETDLFHLGGVVNNNNNNNERLIIRGHTR